MADTESPSSDSTFWVIYLLFLPTIIIGAMLSGPMLYTVVASRGLLLKSRLDKVVLLLLIVSFTWSITGIVRAILMLFIASNAISQFEAGTAYIALIWFLSGNVFLAMTRYFVFKEWPEKTTRKYFMMGLLVAVSFTGCIVWVFSTATTTNKFAPDSKYTYQNVVFFATCSVSLIPSMIAIAVIYSSTYFQLSRRLDETMSSPLEVRVRLQLQKRVLKSTIMMSMGTIICYLPAAGAVVQLGILKKGPLNTGARLFLTEFMLLDTIVTPALLLYFIPKLRHAVAAHWWCFSRLKAGSLVLDSDYDEEGSYSF